MTTMYRYALENDRVVEKFKLRNCAPDPKNMEAEPGTLLGYLEIFAWVIGLGPDEMEELSIDINRSTPEKLIVLQDGPFGKYLFGEIVLKDENAGKNEEK